MSLFISSLNSGSNGNCYYIGNEDEAVLVDAGISCRETEQRMANLQLSMHKIKAIFISHEHIDHIRGMTVLARKYKLPVYIAPATAKHTGLRPGKDLLHAFQTNQPVIIGDLAVTPFVKYHDAADPVSFIVEHNSVRVGIMTDIGVVCNTTIHYFKQCHACFLESNYDERMLEEGTYPLRLKNRIRGGKGHLSNAQAFDLFKNHKPAYMSHLLLSHLSKNNNHPDLALELFKKQSGKTKIIVASRDKETEVYKIVKTAYALPSLTHPVARKESIQLSLFN